MADETTVPPKTLICAFPDCGREVRMLKWMLCGAHYQQHSSGRELKPVIVPTKQQCGFEGCERLAICKGYCDGHYRMYKNGVKLHPIRPSMKVGTTPLFCEFKGCPNRRDSWGLCSAHAKQKTRGVELYSVHRFSPESCLMPDCSKPHFTKGYCSTHFSRYSRYQLTIIQAIMLDVDNAICPLCGENSPQMAIDHDHSCCNTGARTTCGKCLRGVLCYMCNQGLGFLRDDSAVMQRAIEYLESSRLAE